MKRETLPRAMELVQAIELCETILNLIEQSNKYANHDLMVHLRTPAGNHGTYFLLPDPAKKELELSTRKSLEIFEAQLLSL